MARQELTPNEVRPAGLHPASRESQPVEIEMQAILHAPDIDCDIWDDPYFEDAADRAAMDADMSEQARLEENARPLRDAAERLLDTLEDATHISPGTWDAMVTLRAILADIARGE